MSVDVQALLEAERAQTRAHLAALESAFAGVVAASRDTNADDEHDPEGATIAFERSQLQALTSRTRRHLEEIEAALGRVEDRTYGTCAVCGRPIATARLEARPTSVTCIDCAG